MISNFSIYILNFKTIEYLVKLIRNICQQGLDISKWNILEKNPRRSLTYTLVNQLSAQTLVTLNNVGVAAISSWISNEGEVGILLLRWVILIISKLKTGAGHSAQDKRSSSVMRLVLCLRNVIEELMSTIAWTNNSHPRESKKYIVSVEEMSWCGWLSLVTVK